MPIDVQTLAVEGAASVGGDATFAAGVTIPITGSATLSSGVKVVTPGITLAAASFLCIVTGQASSPQVTYSASWTSSTTFTIESSDNSDTAIVNYCILHP